MDAVGSPFSSGLGNATVGNSGSGSFCSPTSTIAWSGNPKTCIPLLTNGEETPCMEVFTNFMTCNMSRVLGGFLSNSVSVPCRETCAYVACKPEMYSKYACVNSSVLSMQSRDARSVSGFHTLSSGFEFSSILFAIPESCGSII